jgi:predicted ribosomally synthesized six-cysteine peptide SCIFF
MNEQIFEAATTAKAREKMKHVKTIVKGTLKDTKDKGCGECQTSCQSACKTSCTLANQDCENTQIKRPR